MNDLLTELRDKKIKLSLTGDELRIDAPKGALTAELLTALKGRKAEIIQLLKQQGDAERHAGIGRAPVKAAYRLSPAQRRFFILNRFEEAAAAYHITYAARIGGNFDMTVFRRALAAVTEQHSSLRTVFEENPTGEPMQRVIALPAEALPVLFCDLTASGNAEETALQKLAEAARVPFDLSAAPPFRVTVCQTGASAFYFSLVVHHILTDAWSMQLMMNCLLQAYARLLRGEPEPVAQAQLQYVDYSEWLSDRSHSAEVRQHRDYWLNEFKTLPAPLDLPAPKNRPPVKTSPGSRISRQLDSAAMERFGAYCRRKGITPFMAAAASVSLVLHRCALAEDIIFGTPVSGRDRPELSGIIGLFTNTLAVRLQCNGRSSFDEHMAYVKQKMLDAFQHQVYPFDELVSELKLPRNTSRSPLFDVMLAYETENAAGGTPQQGPVSLPFTVSSLGGEKNSSPFDLTFIFSEQGGQLRIEAEYSTDIFDAATIGCYLDYIHQLLVSVDTIGQQQLKSIALAAPADTLQWMKKFNPDFPPLDHRDSLLTRFRAQVNQFPERTAIRSAHSAITYSQLFAAAAALAGRIEKQYGPLRGRNAGILLPPGPDLVTGILAILLTGAAYVPIDPEYPAERIAFMREDAALAFVLDAKMLNELSQEQETEPFSFPEVTADMPAVIIYTSGSTGKPKGVTITHGNLACRFLSETDRYPEKFFAVTCLITSVCFDVSLLEILLPLTLGGTVAIPPESVRRDIYELPAFLLQEKVTVLQGTPSFLRMLLAVGQRHEDRNLQLICAGGESLGEDIVRLIREKFPHSLLSNHYGPTETTIDALARSGITDFGKNNIGQPLTYTSVAVISEDHLLQPPCVPGELCIGGPGVSAGYLNRPELNVQSFIADPLAPDAIAYKTGDYGYWLPDGTIVFRGRKDEQVKIRGYRIETGEIERAMMATGLVRQAAVLARPFNGNEIRLVAYYVHGATDPGSQLKSVLRSALPPYMVPAYFIPVPVIPLTSNGKADREKLPLPGMDQEEITAGTPPGSATEIKLAELWEQVLSVRVNAGETDFFEAGGNSFSALLLRRRIADEFGIRLAYKDVFLMSTLQRMAAHIDQAAPGNEVLAAMNRFVPGAINLLAVPSVIGNLSEFHLLAARAEGVFNFYGVSYPGSDDQEKQAGSMETLAAQLADAVAVQIPEGTVIVAGFSMGAAVAFELTKQLEKRKFRVQLVLIDRSPAADSGLALEEDTALRNELERLGQHLSEDERRAYLSFIRNNIRLLSGYEPQGQVEADILAVSGSNSKTIPMETWNRHTRGKFSTAHVPVSHYAILKEEGVAGLFLQIKNYFAGKNSNPS